MNAASQPLALRDLALRRGPRLLFEGLELQLAPGEVLHLQGANGAGKTSLLETLAGLRRAAEGAIDGRPEAGGLHWLGHRNALNLNLSVLENLEFWCGLNGVEPAACLPALERVGLARLRHRLVRTLSAGQKRRAALARLLVSLRPLWLLDEPLDGLDRQGLELFAQLLAEHAARGGMAVVTSHQPLPPGLSGVRSLVLG
ncbi:MAG TPA: heme ABC exporter ATP-binding protein CcmA [Solimonas sp.]|nr:heme ABC exporter ATP-binding protein CcmA [Solimonas sp.]